MIGDINIIVLLNQGLANLLSRGLKNEMISFGGPQLLSKEKHSVTAEVYAKANGNTARFYAGR